MVRERGELAETSWPEALDAAAAGLRKVLDVHGPEGVAVLGGGRGTNEDAYVWSRFAKGVLGTDNVDAQLGDGLPADIVLGLPRATISDRDRAAAIVLLAPDLKEELPVLFLRVREAAEELGVPLIDVAPCDNGLTRNADAVVRYLEGKHAAGGSQMDDGARRRRVLRNVLQGFEAREVHGRFDLLREAPDPFGYHVDRHGRLPRLGLQRGGESPVGEKGRVDAASKVAEILEGVARLAPDLAGHRHSFLGILGNHALHEPSLHGECHELLLSTVVDVSFEGLGPLVLSRDDPLPRGPKVFDQSHVAKDETGLGREIAEQLLLGRGQWVARRHGDRERAEELTLMANCERMIHTGELGKVFAREPDIDRGPIRTGGPTGRTAEIRSHSQPHARLRRPRPCREDLHETWQNVLGGIGGAESIGEPGEHLVGGSSLPVDEPVGQAPGPPADRLEGKDDDDGRGERRDAAALATDTGPHDDDDREIHGRDQHDDCAEHHGLLDHDVEIEHAVLQDRDP